VTKFPLAFECRWEDLVVLLGSQTQYRGSASLSGIPLIPLDAKQYLDLKLGN
jgi:hypothetical protein